MIEVGPDLFVDEAVRGRGAARALIERVAQGARDRGATRFYWHTQEGNARARLLYDQVARFNGFIRYQYPLLRIRRIPSVPLLRDLFGQQHRQRGDPDHPAQPAPVGITVIGAVLSTRRAALLRGGADPVHEFLDGYHTGLLVTIALMAAGVVVSYLTLRPRAASAPLSSEPVAELITVAEIEDVGESLGELVIPAEFTVPSPHPSA